MKPSSRVLIPEPLKIEHDELHRELVKATKELGKVGKAARNVAKILHNHFVKEEKYSIPPLGLLRSIGRRRISRRDEKKAMTLIDLHEEGLPLMLREHRAIVAALKKLIVAAKQEKKLEYARFARKLILHARTEEEVLYPTTLLIGRYLRATRHTRRQAKGS